MKHTMWMGVVLSFVGCAAPKTPPAPVPTDVEPLTKELAQLKDTLARLDNRLGHLESEMSASSAENELTAMTIDSVGWSTDDQRLKNLESEPVLVCHVAEWRGFGKLLRFTRLADRSFSLDAEDGSSVSAGLDTGGISNSDGSLRFVVLRPREPLDPKARYHLHAQNHNDRYRWSLPPELIVAAPNTTR